MKYYLKHTKNNWLLCDDSDVLANIYREKDKWLATDKNDHCLVKITGTNDPVIETDIHTAAIKTISDTLQFSPLERIRSIEFTLNDNEYSIVSDKPGVYQALVDDEAHHMELSLFLNGVIESETSFDETLVIGTAILWMQAYNDIDIV